HPTCSKVVGLRYRSIARYGARVANRNNIVRPVFRQIPDPRNHGLRGHFRTGFEFGSLVRPAKLNLDVGAADVDDENPKPPATRAFGANSTHRYTRWCACLAAMSRTSGWTTAGSCQAPTSFAISPDWRGPQEYGSYSFSGVSEFKIGSTTRHCASALSSRENNVRSPFMASPINRS